MADKNNKPRTEFSLLEPHKNPKSKKGSKPKDEETSSKLKGGEKK